MFDLLINDPMTNLLLIFYWLLGGQTLLAVAALTLLTRLITLPLTLQQQKSAQGMQEMQPQLQKLQEKYKGDKEKLAQEQMKLYKEYGFNPVGGCLPLLIQLPIMIGLYQGIIRSLAASPIQLFQLSQHIYRWIPGLQLSTILPLQSRFLWLDLGMPDPYFVLPVLVVLSTWLMNRMMQTPAADKQQQQMNQQMQYMMPLMFGFISMSYAAGLSIYFIISNLIGIAQFYLVRLYQQRQKERQVPQRGTLTKSTSRSKTGVSDGKSIDG